ncbi:DUF5684 domain-containing protein [Lysinibacter sp. HNR]|uniref:DUF5684 domain-containing protein n=1 Tax=Lysinibacter sp. HNR TaxID=3031408 RepID=UPI0024360FB4|nr:DUF5684 domain-containing protein [Lysinibacter sp. HNR]WGD36343.1 DUF5684 domain-containing protein [Lysinibacter sp. HNR]
MTASDVSVLMAFNAIVLIPSVLILVVMIIAMWKMFTKAGEPGWAAIIPIVNIYYLLKIAGKPWWWLLLLIIPVVSLILQVMLALRIGRNFGQGGAFSVFLLWLLAPIGYLVLGFGSSTYRKVD